MSARGGGKPWGPVDDCWRWNVNLDTSVMGSPIVDLILGGERNPGAAAAAKLNAARKAALGDDADAWAAKAEEKAPSEKAPSEKAPSPEPKIESEIKSEPDADVAEAAALIAHTDAATVDRSREPRVVTDPPLNRWGEPEPNVTCLVCGDFGDDSEFVLCDGCPAGGHLDCLKLIRKPDSGDDWHCDACEGGKLAGIQPPGRAGFEAAAVNRAALEAARERGGATGGASVSSVPGATGAVRFYFWFFVFVRAIGMTRFFLCAGSQRRPRRRAQPAGVRPPDALHQLRGRGRAGCTPRAAAVPPADRIRREQARVLGVERDARRRCVSFYFRTCN